MIKTKRKKGFYSISAVAEMLSIHQQTIRLYERKGLIAPKRSEGDTRLFSESDVDRLEEIIHLTHSVGVNLAGVEIILRQKKQIERLQKDMNKLFNSVQESLTKETESQKEEIKRSMERLAQLKNKQHPQLPSFEDTE